MTDRPDSDDSAKDYLPDWRLKIDATPEELAQAIFANATPPDPSLRKRNRPDDTSEGLPDGDSG